MSRYQQPLQLLLNGSLRGICMRPSGIARLCLAALASLLCAAAAPPGTYNPRETFAPFDMGQAVNAFRSGSGLPGPAYWQNRADYTIRASLDPTTHAISGTVEIRY